MTATARNRINAYTMTQNHIIKVGPNDLRAVIVARRALALLADALEDAGGTRGVQIGLALDDLTLLIDRMADELGTSTAGIIHLDTHSRRA